MKIRICSKCGKHNSVQDWQCVECGQTLSMDTLVESDARAPDRGDSEQEPSISSTTSGVEPSTRSISQPKDTRRYTETKATIICPQCGKANEGGAVCRYCHHVLSKKIASRERGGCLSLWLVLVMGSNLLGIFGFATEGTLNFLALALSIGHFACAAALWNWKKWGAYGLAVSFALTFILGLVFVDMLSLVSAVVPAILLYFLASPKWHLMD